MRGIIQLTVMLLRVRAKARTAGLTWKETLNLISDSSMANLEWMESFKYMSKDNIKINKNEGRA